jgi:hypothetical protein
MEVPCPVPLSQPWSPVGYQVVQVSEEKNLPVEGGPPKVKRKVARSPLGYRVNVVADEDIPLRPQAHAKADFLASALQRARILKNQPQTRPVLIWGPIVAGGFFFLLPVIAIAFGLASRAQEPPRHFVQAQQFEPPPMPPPPEIIIPDELFKAVPEKTPAEDKGGIPQPDQKNQANANLKDGAGCENFGTQVEFVRNPQVASKMAREEGKLTFLLHVSGNFEDARFT